MKKSVISFIAVMLIIIFLGVTAVTGVYIPGGWTMPFRDAACRTPQMHRIRAPRIRPAPARQIRRAQILQTRPMAVRRILQLTPVQRIQPIRTLRIRLTPVRRRRIQGIPARMTPRRERNTELTAIIPSVLDTEHGIRLGLDLVGGSRIVYEAVLPDGYDMGNLADDMQTAQAMIRQRLTSQGFTEATVALSGDNRLTVEIPQITNPEEAVQTLGTTAQLLFMDIDGYNEYMTAMSEDANTDAAQYALLTGSDISGASAQYGDPTGGASMQAELRCRLSSPARASRSLQMRPSRLQHVRTAITSC